jgi:PAS domain S-box-containing protein
MAADLSGRTIQVLYEISLAISPEADVERTAESALSAYLKKLNCSAAAVLRPVAPDDDGGRKVLSAVPEEDSFLGAVEGVRDRLPETRPGVEAELPAADEIEPGAHRYVMLLPDFGVLVLLKRGSPLPEGILVSLPDLNEKLATACNRVAVQEQYENQYRELFEQAPVMFAITRRRDGEPVLVDCNERFAEKLGYTSAELEGRPLTDLYTDDSAERLREGGYDEALDGQFGTGERVLRTKGGTEITATVRATPRIGDDGTVVGTRALFIDVTEMKRQQVQISVLNRVLRHNIRNDLAVIRSKIEMALNREDAAAHLRDAYEKTEDLSAAADLARQIQEILDETDLVRHDIVGLVESLVERAREEFPGATVAATIEPDSVHVLATTALERALWELIENACHHAGEAPTVRVTVERGETTATVTVADDGPGIPEIERRILGEIEETDTEHGSGLGLWLAYWVIDMSGGELSFDRDGGTVATVTLPRSAGGA